ncbi:hypothetical protein [Chamaesiphon polymorphus]|nr:hypothetical protein [Chamaesiphon polymorphus]
MGLSDSIGLTRKLEIETDDRDAICPIVNEPFVDRRKLLYGCQ